MLEDLKTRYLMLFERVPATFDEAVDQALELVELESLIDEMEV
jgi:hypothetical protein